MLSVTQTIPDHGEICENNISGEFYMTKDILVRVRGTQTIGEEEDTVEMITPGTYYEKNGKQYFIYDESLDETGEPLPGSFRVRPRRSAADSHLRLSPHCHRRSFSP